MKVLKIQVSDDQYDMEMRVAKKRKKSLRSIILRVLFELDHADENERMRKKRPKDESMHK